MASGPGKPHSKAARQTQAAHPRRLLTQLFYSTVRMPVRESLPPAAGFPASTAHGTCFPGTCRGQTQDRGSTAKPCPLRRKGQSAGKKQASSLAVSGEYRATLPAPRSPFRSIQASAVEAGMGDSLSTDRGSSQETRRPPRCSPRAAAQPAAQCPAHCAWGWPLRQQAFPGLLSPTHGHVEAHTKFRKHF